MKKLKHNFYKLVSILNDCEFHDGTALGAELGISRAAVWKMIKKLQNYQIQVDSVKAKGYRFQEALYLLDEKQIKKSLTHKKINLNVFEEIDSTSSFLKPYIFQKNIQVCVAEKQTLGRGRFNREWHSPFGENLYVSLLIPLNCHFQQLQGLSTALSLLIAKSIEASFVIPDTLSLKWPNDIYCGNAKLGGCLTEIQAESNSLCGIIVGIGINVNMLEAQDKSFKQPWSSIRKLNSLNNDRNILCIHLINAFTDYFKDLQNIEFKCLRSEYNQRDYLRNKIIKIKANNAIYKGKMLGLDDMGNLQLKLSNGSVMIFSSGDATLVAQ